MAEKKAKAKKKSVVKKKATVKKPVAKKKVTAKKPVAKKKTAKKTLKAATRVELTAAGCCAVPGGTPVVR